MNINKLVKTGKKLVMSGTTAYRYQRPVKGEDFSKLHTMLLTIGFHRAGSSLVGYLLTAHPNTVIAHEPTLCHLYSTKNIVLLLRGILSKNEESYTNAIKAQKVEIDKIRSAPKELKARYLYHEERYVFVANQKQNHCQSLEVIGIKDSYETTHALLRGNTLQKFTALCKKQKISLKFIFTVRNPYDMIASEGIHHRLLYEKERPFISIINRNHNLFLEDTILRYEKLSETNKNLLSQIKAQNQNIFISRHEDMVADAKDQLTKLCRFLKVKASYDYLNDASLAVCPTLRKSRHGIDWSEAQKERVAKLIDRYNIFSGYSWAS